MNYCNNQNWWLLLNSTDPADELLWLINELQSSELVNEKVLIIGHIPPGSNDCLQVWSSNYYRIVNRYESTITAQFFGHTHQDEFQLFYEEEEPQFNVHGQLVAENPFAKAREAAEKEFELSVQKMVNVSNVSTKDDEKDEYKIFESYRPTSVAYIGPSATTFGGVNPGYRIYTIDAKTFQVIDHETYYANLTAANLDAINVNNRNKINSQTSAANQRFNYNSWFGGNSDHQDGSHVNHDPSLKFELSYRAKDMYKFVNLSPISWHRLIIEMVSNEDLFKQFERLFFNRSDNYKPCTDNVCKADILCRLISGKAHDYNICQKFLKDLDILSNNIDGSSI